jgi:RNA polymerase sigma factor (sigma-70 family)
MEPARTRPSRMLGAMTDPDLVAAVRDGDDPAFEELYRRYHHRIAAYVRRMVRDPARAEDLAQDAFFSALRRMRATDAQIAFKPWIFEIARNAAIDHWRRTSRAEEVSVEAEEQLRASDRVRLVGSAGPDSALVDKERLEHLRGAFDELSAVHTRILVMRELEGLSYREIAERLDLSRASVESALFRARRRLESEYADISEGRRCTAMRTVMARLAEGLQDRRDEGRLARHARRCHVCRRRARELGVDPLAASRLRRKAAALLPLPLFTRRGGHAAHGGAASGGQGAGGLSGLLPTGAQVGTAVAERAAAIVAAAALAGAGGMALSGDMFGGERDGAKRPSIEQLAPAPAKGTNAVGHAPGRLGEAGGTDAQGGGDARSRPGAGTGGEAGGDHAAGSQQAAFGAPGDAPAGGGLPLPGVPGVESAPRGPYGGGTQLPAPPGSPSVEMPAAPGLELPQAQPRLEAPLAAPVVPAIPATDSGVTLDGATRTAAG